MVAAAAKDILVRFSAADMEILGQAPPTGEMGFATVTDWEYYGGQRNPLDLNTPARTLDTSGTTAPDVTTACSQDVVASPALRWAAGGSRRPA
ncbi:hypothetical protein T484DRAFT_1764239 [Baffinella frigidus]|nr:hypothetical protein T484DRAFT_1764239 [Cryptophyta sp. CCMP2293]